MKKQEEKEKKVANEGVKKNILGIESCWACTTQLGWTVVKAFRK